MKSVLVFVLVLCAISVHATCDQDINFGKPAIRSVAMNKAMHLKEKQWKKCAEEHLCPNNSAENLINVPCVNGFAGEYPCCGVDLKAFIKLGDLGTRGDANDIWGWTDSVTHHEYAIIGLFDGTSFIDVTNPIAPSVIGFLPTHTVGSTWRDIKVYQNHAYIVSEARGHGMQVFDLTQLRTLERRPFRFNNGTFNLSLIPQLTETAFYPQFGSAHNIVINEETGFAYVVGTQTCAGGLHVVNIQHPNSPVCAGCYAADGYTHDAQCVIYRGPDADYVNKEICFCYNEDSLTIVDVSDKDHMSMISRTSYENVFYTHQGWLFPDSTHLLLNDELDELEGPNPRTRTMLWDVRDLDKPILEDSFYAKQHSIDHNLYTLGNKAFLANYCNGLRVLDISGVAQGRALRQIAWFDVAPDCDAVQFLGSWSSYPYFPSGTIVVSSIERGLFVLALNGQTCEEN